MINDQKALWKIEKDRDIFSNEVLKGLNFLSEKDYIQLRTNIEYNPLCIMSEFRQFE